MTYRTKAAHELVDWLRIQEAKYGHNYTVATNAHDRGMWAGYRDATRAYADFAEQWLERIEQEAELVPFPEPDPIEWLADQMADYRPMAGDYRDFPA